MGEKHIRWNYDLVLKYAKENSECVLISTGYKTTKDKLNFRCKCGNEFTTTFDRFKNKDKKQCNPCGREIGAKTDRFTFDYVKDFIENETKSGCTLLSTEYTGISEKMNFTCKCGDEFQTTFQKFKDRDKRQCTPCGYNNIKTFFTFDYDYVKNWIETESDCKLLSETYVGCYEALLLECDCGDAFRVSFSNFKSRKSKKCTKCSALFSEGEYLISEYLKENEVMFEEQYTFDNLKAENEMHKLRFDFAIFNKRNYITMLVEFDGVQHEKPIDFFGGKKAFKQLKLNDKRKENYCKSNGIHLLRIPYSDKDEIDSILESELNNYDNTESSHLYVGGRCNDYSERK